MVVVVAVVVVVVVVAVVAVVIGLVLVVAVVVPVVVAVVVPVVVPVVVLVPVSSPVVSSESSESSSCGCAVAVTCGLGWVVGDGAGRTTVRTTSVTHVPFSRLLPSGQEAHLTFGFGCAGVVVATSWAVSCDAGRASGVATWVR